MKRLSEFIGKPNITESKEDVVYSVYCSDGTMVNYFKTKEEADECANAMNKEFSSNNATVKVEPRSEFEKD